MAGGWPWGVFHAADIIKEIWHDGWVRPAWAKLSYARGWMTAVEYYAIPMSVRVPSPFQYLYRESPMFRMLKRSA